MKYDAEHHQNPKPLTEACKDAFFHLQKNLLLVDSAWQQKLMNMASLISRLLFYVKQLLKEYESENKEHCLFFILLTSPD